MTKLLHIWHRLLQSKYLSIYLKTKKYTPRWKQSTRKWKVWDLRTLHQYNKREKVSTLACLDFTKDSAAFEGLSLWDIKSAENNMQRND